MQRDRLLGVAALAGHSCTHRRDIGLNIHAFQQILQDSPGDLLDIGHVGLGGGWRLRFASTPLLRWRRRGRFIIVDNRHAHQRLFVVAARLQHFDRDLVAIFSELGQRQLDRLSDSAGADLDALHIVLIFLEIRDRILEIDCGVSISHL